MAGVNKVIILGKLGADPESINLQSGSKVCKFSIATSESFTDKQGQKIENTEWHRIELWEKLADIAQAYLKKGSTVYIEGKIKTEKYTDKDGIEKYVTKIRGTAITLVGDKQESASKAPQAGNAPATTTSGASFNSEGEDLPF
jgi:single-strand DNA-binding protein